MPLPSRPAETRPTWTEEYRHQKEVEYVAKQSAKWIKNHLKGVGEIRGEPARIKLRSDVLKIWEK